MHLSTKIPDPSLSVLSLMAEYHDSAPSSSRIRAAERLQRQRLIEELLRPKRFLAEGRHRVPLAIHAHNRVRVETGRTTGVGTAEAFTIDTVEVSMEPETARRLRPLEPVVVAIQSGRPGVWWRFLAHVVRVGCPGRELRLRLERTLGCRASEAES